SSTARRIASCWRTGRREARACSSSCPSARVPARRRVATSRLSCWRSCRMLRAFIVDDEPSARDRLRDLLERQRDVDVVGESADVPGALEAIREAPPDVVFLDVQMPGLDGFQLIEAVGARAMPAVVFVTAHEEHALRAFDVDAVDYLLKPFDEERFGAALGRVREELERRQLRRGALADDKTQRKKPLDRLPLRSAGRVSFLRVD